MRRTAVPLLVGLWGCSDEAPEPASALEPVISELRQVVPSDGLPPEVVPQPANNNLHATWHGDRLYLAFRSAPTHFASSEVEMFVVSTTDEQSWRFEGRFAIGTDLREPHLLSWGDELLLYMAVLGDNPLDFEPLGMVHSRQVAPGSWTELIWHGEPAGFIPWRVKVIEGRAHMIGYSGGAEVYDPDGEPIEVHWLVSDDAETWDAAVPGQPVVLTGGGSEADFALLDNGDLIAVVRNEAGDDEGFGSRICRAPADALGDWECATDPRKYDSPLVFRQDGAVWLVARRNVTDTGHYDLGMTELSDSEKYLAYQVDYWQQPKRCAVWRVDPDALTVEWAADLPSRGDTCFPARVIVDGSSVLYNYSSDVDGPDVTWLEGQNLPTHIYRMKLSFQ